MTEKNVNIPLLLREKFGEDFGPENVLGYRYSSGYWEEDESSWDYPIRDFHEKPEVHIFVVNDKKEQLVTIRKNDIQSDADTTFDDLHYWLAGIFGKENTVKTDGVFGIIKENGKYQIEFGQVATTTLDYFHAGMMIDKITKLLPDGFVFIGDENGCKWNWLHHQGDLKVNVFCEISMGFAENHRAYYHFDIWHDADNPLEISSAKEKELNTACLSIAKMLLDEYPGDMYNHILVIARHVDLSTMEELGSVEFDVPLNRDETEKLRCLLFASEFFYPENLRWEDGELFHKIENKAETLLAEALGLPRPLGYIGMHWVEGERKRLLWGERCLTEVDINKKRSYIDGLGNQEPSREELLAGISHRFIWKEIWKRETGHMWEKYTLLKRTPSEDELEYADCSHYAVRLLDLPTDIIIKLLTNK